jgi:hypothetical protein
MSHFPHKWVVIDYGEEVGYAPQRYAILAGWYGGFAGSDSWKRSSPIVKWDFKEDGLEVSTESGSKYVLHKNTIGVTMLTQSLISDAGLTVVSKWEDVCKLLK